MTYAPKVNDYVKWHHGEFIDEGWVYFQCNDYITIEVGTKDKPDTLVDIHKKTHILVVCQSWYWHELEYLHSRGDIGVSEYKSQEHRPIDP